MLLVCCARQGCWNCRPADLWVADRKRVRWDLSGDGGNQLLEDTVRKLELLDATGQEVQVIAFSAQQGHRDAYFKNRALKDLLDQLEYSSDAVTTRFVDFDRERLTAEQLSVREYGHLVILHGTMDDNVHLQNALHLAYALQRAGKDFELMVYPKSRHGVRDDEQRYHTSFIKDFAPQPGRTLEAGIRAYL